MTTIAVIYKKEDRLISATAQQVIKELKKKGYKIDLDKAKFALTFGGDGTILRSARLLAKNQTPILGIHLGGLGFLSEIELHNLDEALEQVKKGKFKIEERTMIEALVGGKRLVALNDIVISNSGIARVIKLEIKGIAEYTSDGIIFSTATGSTAYNLSAGGPILTPDSRSMVISAICPHSISTRPLVVEQPVTAVLNRGKKAILTADGQQLFPLHEGQKVRIQRSQEKTRFIRLAGYDFFKRVERAFGFAARI
ncbi:MAG: NAD(+)/NADH kinase [Candidatus Margulisbacteria bacterium]|nr:NAD(+)/NADH kinase [Candidatus Margulisiibacteriota bacterium]